LFETNYYESGSCQGDKGMVTTKALFPLKNMECQEIISRLLPQNAQKSSNNYPQSHHGQMKNDVTLLYLHKTLLWRSPFRTVDLEATKRGQLTIFNRQSWQKLFIISSAIFPELFLMIKDPEIIKFTMDANGPHRQFVWSTL